MFFDSSTKAHTAHSPTETILAMEFNDIDAGAQRLSVMSQPFTTFN